MGVLCVFTKDLYSHYFLYMRLSKGIFISDSLTVIFSILFMRSSFIDVNRFHAYLYTTYNILKRMIQCKKILRKIQKENISKFKNLSTDTRAISLVLCSIVIKNHKNIHKHLFSHKKKKNQMS